MKINSHLAALLIESINHCTSLLNRLVLLMEPCARPIGQAVALYLLPGIKTEGIFKMALNFAVKQTSTLTLIARDASGNVAQFQGKPEFATSDATVVTVSADGVVAAVAPGTARVIATVDADMGEGVKALVGTLDVSVVAGAAIVLEIQAGLVTDVVAADSGTAEQTTA
jgi:hypothetical protein